MNKARQILIDTNLLVLFIVGITDPKLIELHKKTKNFEIEDFEMLNNFMGAYQKVLVTPHILTETSNLISYIQDPYKTSLMRTLKNFTLRVEEKIEASSNVAEHQTFLRLGLADAGILSQLDQSVDMVTADLQLYLSASRLHPERAMNFNHLRQQRIFSA